MFGALGLVEIIMNETECVRWYKFEYSFRDILSYILKKNMKYKIFSLECNTQASGSLDNQCSAPK